MKWLWLLVVGGCVMGGFQAAATLEADSAPKQAAGMAMAIAWAVIPYCFVRALQQMDGPEKELRRIREALDSHTKLLGMIAAASPKSAPLDGGARSASQRRCTNCNTPALGDEADCRGCGATLAKAG
jgi:hypothetical protein